MSEHVENAATESSAEAVSTDLRRVRDRLVKVRAAIAAAGAPSPAVVGEFADHLKSKKPVAVGEFADHLKSKHSAAVSEFADHLRQNRTEAVHEVADGSAPPRAASPKR
jgi:hypothetical protein